MKWTTEKIDYFKKVYPYNVNRKIAFAFGCSYSSVKNMAVKLGLRKVYTNCGAFTPGSIPWNKGKNYSPKGSEKSWFKKGQVPKTAKTGEITLRKDHGGNWHMYYCWEDKRIPVQHIVYRVRHGDIPEGHIVTFKDGNTLNVKSENLTVISRAENAERNRNRKKAGETLRKIWYAERVRKKYGLPPKTGLGKLLSENH